MLKETIKTYLISAIIQAKKEGVSPDFDLERTEIETKNSIIYGDYSTNIAFLLAKEAKKQPKAIGALLKEKIEGLDPKKDIFEKIEIRGEGFINFFLSKTALFSELKKILEEKEKYGNLKTGKGRSLQVEFISANPTGPLTVGNARGGVFGDCLASILEKSGWKTEREYYVNDCGKQILALGNSVLKNKEAVYRGDYIEALYREMKGKNSYKAGQAAAKKIIEKIIKRTVKNFGIEYDNWFFESDLHYSRKIEKAIAYLEKKNLIYKKDGAVWFKSKKFGDIRDRVLIKKDGEKTYLAGDIAYHRYKFEEKKFDKAINIWGADHYGDIPGLQAGVWALGHKGKLDVVLLQFVTIFEKGKTKKMSKRKGVFKTLDDLLESVGKDVARFFFLERSANAHLNFDLDLAREQSEKNPVYYIQYAHARICAILRKCAKFQINPKSKIQNLKLKLLKHPSELALIKQLIRLPEIVGDTARDYQVQRVPQYALDLAASFHQFYRDCNVLKEKEDLKTARLNLLLATKDVLRETLRLMGIFAPKKM